jgi:multimeric flavodoxin WrbA
MSGERIRLAAICGSPRKRGNSAFLLEHAVRGAEESLGDLLDTTVYSVAGKSIAPCDACSRCAKLGDCRTEDDFQELRNLWVGADAVIYSVPVYHYSIPAQLKCFIDRLGNSLDSFYGGRMVKDLKVIGAIAQGAHLFSGQEHAIAELVNHALCMGCVPMAGDCWESYVGAGGWTQSSERKDSLKKLYADGQEEARVAVQAASTLGRRVVQVAMLLKAGGNHHRELLEADGGYEVFLERLA